MNKKQFYNDIESWIGPLEYGTEYEKLDNKFKKWLPVFWTGKQKQQWNSFLDNYFEFYEDNNQKQRRWKRDIWHNRNKASPQYEMYRYLSYDELLWQDSMDMRREGEYRLDSMPNGWYVVKDIGEVDVYLMYKENELVYYFNPGGMFQSLWLNGPIEFIGDTEFNALHLGYNLIEKPRWMFLNWEEGIEEAK